MPHQIETVIQIALENMQKAKVVNDKASMLAQGNGVMHYFVETLAAMYLDKEQQEQVETLVRLHMDCSYGYEYKGRELVNRAPLPTKRLYGAASQAV